MEDGTAQVVYLETFALMHEDYLRDAIPLDRGTVRLRVHVLSPVDLAVSKIACFADAESERRVTAIIRLEPVRDFSLLSGFRSPCAARPE